MNTIKGILFVLVIFNTPPAFSQTTEEGNYNCFSILVGKDATIDNSVMLAHNEDDKGTQLVNLYKVPKLQHDEKIINPLKNEPQIPQVKETYSYIWVEMINEDFADSYMNEWGVTISSNQCSSKEEYGELKNGGVGYWLRRLMAERAKSAREAVKIAGKIINEYGYASSGRTYCVADANESWVMAVVMGKHWVAQRVPDKEVVVVPNYYTIEEINLKDTVNFLGSPDIVEYAISKGWYNPEKEGRFNFRKVYGSSSSLESMSNIARKWVAINLISERRYGIDEHFPFSVKPKEKVTVVSLMRILRTHYEETLYAITDGNPHVGDIMPICSNTNQYGFVAHLRAEMPADLGYVLWFAPRRPCFQPFIPLYFGIEAIPPGYNYQNDQTAIQNHFITPPDSIAGNQDLAFPAFCKKAERIDDNYLRLITSEQIRIKKLQKHMLDSQQKFEGEVISMFKENPSQAKKMLTDFTTENAEVLLQLNK